MRHDRRLPLAVLALSLLLLPACLGDTGSGDEGMAIAVKVPSVPPCELVEPAEIREILGVEPGQPVDPGPQGPMFQCIWESPDEGAGPHLHLVLLPSPASDLDTFLTQARESIGEEAEAWTLEPVDGLGDFAVTMGPENYSVLQVVDGDRLLQIKTIQTNDRTALENARLLAGIVLARLRGEEPGPTPGAGETGEDAGTAAEGSAEEAPH